MNLIPGCKKPDSIMNYITRIIYSQNETSDYLTTN